MFAPPPPPPTFFQVVAIVMDFLTDLQILQDLLDASSRRGVAVYVVLDAKGVPDFLDMCSRLQINAMHLRVSSKLFKLNMTGHLRGPRPTDNRKHGNLLGVPAPACDCTSYRDFKKMTRLICWTLEDMFR